MHGRDKDGKDVQQIVFARYNYDTKEIDTLAKLRTGDVAESCTVGNIAALLSDWVNKKGGMGLGKHVGRALHGDHHTLQREEIAFCLGMVIGLGEQELRWTDPRNETAIKTAKKITESLESGDLSIGRFI